MINRESMESYNLGALADIIANQTGLAPLALAELERRKTVFQQHAAEAQKRAAAAQEMAADAAKETARYTQASARYMRWSAIVLTASSVVTTFFLAWDHWRSVIR